LTTTSVANTNNLNSMSRFVYTEIDMYGPSWILSESLIPGGYFYNTYLNKPAVLAPNYNYNWIGGTILVLGGSVVIAADVVAIVGSEGWALVTPVPYYMAYEGVSMISQGLKVGWNVNTPDFPIIPYLY
jgi:hypothetical protein